MSEAREPLKIYTVLPDEVRGLHPHGQWVLDAPGGIINFATDIIGDHTPDVVPWARKLERFRRQTRPSFLEDHSSIWRWLLRKRGRTLRSEMVLEFISPHMPGQYFLHRAALDHIMLTHCAWSAKVMARPSQDGNVSVVDAAGLPIVRRNLK